MHIIDQLWLDLYLSYVEDAREFGFVPVSFDEYKNSIREV